MKVTFLILVIIAITAYAWKVRRRVPVLVALEDVAEVRLPEDLRLDAGRTEHTGDKSTFHFRRVNDTHLNGQTSYAELLSLSLLAEDMPCAEGINIEETVYERHPVKEPAWRIRITDPKAGVAIDWQGFKKHYTAEKAKAYLYEIRDSVKWKRDRAGHFRSHRDWDVAHRERNLQLVAEALAMLGLPPVEEGKWTAHGDWRYSIDNERPQRFHLVRVIAHVQLPDGPFRLLTPLTVFRYVRGGWWQDNQGLGGGIVPKALLAGLTDEMASREQVYFYRIQALQLWKEHDSVEMAIRDLMREGDHRAEEFYQRGAVDGDAEP